MLITATETVYLIRDEKAFMKVMIAKYEAYLDLCIATGVRAKTYAEWVRSV